MVTIGVCFHGYYRFMLELKKEQCVDFAKKIHQMASAVGCKVNQFYLSISCFVLNNK